MGDNDLKSCSHKCCSVNEVNLKELSHCSTLCSHQCSQGYKASSDPSCQITCFMKCQEQEQQNQKVLNNNLGTLNSLKISNSGREPKSLITEYYSYDEDPNDYRNYLLCENDCLALISLGAASLCQRNCALVYIEDISLAMK